MTDVFLLKQLWVVEVLTARCAVHQGTIAWTSRIRTEDLDADWISCGSAGSPLADDAHRMWSGRPCAAHAPRHLSAT